MRRILVCPTRHVAAVAAERAPSHVVAFAAPSPSPRLRRGGPSHAEGVSRGGGARRELGDGELGGDAPHPGPPLRSGSALPTTSWGEGGAPPIELRLLFNDIPEPRPGLVAPSWEGIAELLAFGEGWDGARPLLVHCQMGISRSPAAALILAAAARPELDEEALAAALRNAAPCATPNPLMIALADDLLSREGRLARAARTIGRGADYVPYRMFELILPATT